MNKLLMHWSDYARLASHMHSVDEKSVLKAKWGKWLISAKDFVTSITSDPPQFDKLSALSRELEKRLEDWAILSTCAYTRGTRQLHLQLTFVVSNVIDNNFVYFDDAQLLGHLSLQLSPVYDIVKQYLKTADPVVSVIRPLELGAPQHVNELAYLSVFRSYYTSEDHRSGMPFAASAFLTYGLFEF